jgi:hypothetical protein
MIDILKRFARSATAGCLAFVGMTAIVTAPAQAAYIQNFDVVPSPGWVMDQNNVPTNSPLWFQGIDPAANPLSFPAYNGPPTSYAAASWSLGSSQIDTWMLSPELILNNGDTFSFYARQQDYVGPGNSDPFGFANALQVRLSTSGASTDIGSAYGDVGVFTSLQVDINPSFAKAGFPEVWTLYSFSYTGASTTGRVGFRFYTPDVDEYGSYIGVDAFETTATLVPEPTSIMLMGIGLVGLAYHRRRNRTQD